MSTPHPSKQHDPPVERVRQLEDRVQQLTHELEHLQRLAMLGTLSAGVAHEVNNLLTPALGYAELAGQHPDDLELQRKAMARTVTAMKTAGRVIRAILGVAAGTDEAELADVARTFDDALTCLGNAPAKARVTVTTRIPPGLQVAIRPIALQQVLMNLTLNAIQAMGGSGGEVAITGEECPGGLVRLIVQDTGPGIPRELADRLFQPFVSGQPPHTDEGRVRGTGLGLAICHDLIASAGGTIAAQATPGKGAAFVVTLPAATPNVSRKSA